MFGKVKGLETKRELKKKRVKMEHLIRLLRENTPNFGEIRVVGIGAIVLESLILLFLAVAYFSAFKIRAKISSTKNLFSILILLTILLRIAWWYGLSLFFAIKM